CHQHNYYPYTF
nr:immunoglobulin light chain junction region [Macaca mulatta]MOW11722.1 immunoglobulin light chain junction region [Macaca mulatta]MOW12050.1 immunoglobulin light chain junction region [Macaca mulatta]